MTLADYLKRHGLTLTEFGARIGRSAATVSRIKRGIDSPNWQTMRAIEKATKGAVRPDDFLKNKRTAA